MTIKYGMNNAKHVYWTYHKNYTGIKEFIDPRLPVAKLIGWKKSTGEYTDFTLPEPDNYNRAIAAVNAIDCKLVEDQVVYFDEHNQLWITLMYVPESQTNDIDLWIKSIDKIAVWCHLKPPQLKKLRTFLWTRDNISDRNMTDNERLYTMGYYEKLKVKYFDDDTEYVDSLLGSARAILSDPIPEELDDKVEDY